MPRIPCIMREFFSAVNPICGFGNLGGLPRALCVALASRPSGLSRVVIDSFRFGKKYVLTLNSFRPNL